MITATPQLQKLIVAVRDCLIEQPTDLIYLKLSLDNLLSFLTTTEGRTNINIEATDSYFCLHNENGFNWDSLPDEYKLILDDIGGQLHDTIDSSEIARNFDSTPEQLLERLRNIKNG